MFRFGVLGAAAINRDALVKPVNGRDDVELASVAARDRTRAVTHAAKHGIATVHDTYEAILDDPSIDAVYIPLPPTLHERWAIAAIEAGKHVLVEKPFADTARAARAIRTAADGAVDDQGRRLVVMEGFHWRHHPMAARMLDIVASGEVGELVDVSGAFRAPILGKDNIRWNADLGGGALADLGCYVLHQMRTIVGEEPRVASARMRRARGVDRSTTAQLAFPSGVGGTLDCSLASPKPFACRLHITGTLGTVKAFLPVLGHLGFLRVSTPDGRRRIRDWSGTTYDHQMESFVRAVVDGTPAPIDVDDAVANMEAMDRIRAAAGHPNQTGPVT